MHRLSTVQLLSIWSELESALYCRNSFGTDTAEIYMYTLMPYCPMAAAKGQYDAEMIHDSSCALVNVLDHFEKTHDAKTWINGETLDAIRSAGGRAYESRVVVRVAPKHKREVVSNISKLLERHIADLSPEARCELKAELFGSYCRECCGADPQCPCSNDE